MRAVTFDYGQTLAELDTEFLARRVAERGARVRRESLDAASPSAWAAYEDAKHRGEEGSRAWATFMRTLLENAGVEGDGRPDLANRLVDFLWSEQPRRNLWRRPIPGMRELVEELAGGGIPLGIVSNSEGRMAELLEEMGLSPYFQAVADSGVLGFEKPDRRIFDFTAELLGVPVTETVHVGDAWEADVLGALGVGARALWIQRDAASRSLPPGVQACSSAEDVRTALSGWGFAV